ncbi:MAG: polyprenyl synthetase family protein [Gemmatimonadetes bacterium]|nr:polyprenyl synthetase family protein [Gemmatimonadota bacterium]
MQLHHPIAVSAFAAVGGETGGRPDLLGGALMTPNPSPTARTAPPRLAQIQRPIRRELDGLVGELRRIIVGDFDLIEEVNQYLLLMRGKLFRPTLLLLCNKVGGRPHESAVTLAAVVELVHLATLVHDDAVDHSVLRRGMPTVNALWSHQVSIIMGDYLYSRSVAELAKLGSLEAIRVLAVAANEMSAGEMRQLTSCDALDFDEAEYYRLIAAKTASLMAAACEIGALVGAEAYRDQLARFGHNLGMAFQIIDDVLDYTESEAVTGKPTGHDLRERKVTLPLVGALRSASGAEWCEVRRFFTLTDPDERAIERIVEIVRDRNGLEYARQSARHFGDRALASLERLAEDPAVEALRQSVAYVIGRRR